MYGLEPLKVVFGESFEDEGPKLKTSGASETVERHNAGWVSKNKKGEGIALRIYSGFYIKVLVHSC